MKFNPRDHVFLCTTNLPLPPGLLHKLFALWIGPHEVAEVISAVAYCLSLQPELAKHNMFYMYLFKPHHSLVPSYPAPIIAANDNAAKYIEALLCHCICKYNDTMKTEYLVKLKGYLMHEATWEPTEN